MSARQIYYALCPLPIACLLISLFVPADTHATAAASRHPFDWIALAIFGSPFLGGIGLALIWSELSVGRPARGLMIATGIAALPTLYFLAATFLHR